MDRSGELEEWIPVGEWPSLDKAHEHALVVLAMRHDCRVRRGVDGYALEVEPDVAGAAGEELVLYAVEQEMPGRKIAKAERDGGFAAVVIWGLVLLTVYLAQLRTSGMEANFANSSVALLRDSEWWRPFTALFLHADMEHLLGNLFIGGLFCGLVGGWLGAVRGWALILLSGVMGNVLTAVVHWPEPFRSIGASTATFGALGLLVGHGLVEAWRARRYRKLKPLLVPLGMGVALLGWFGVGGENTDVLGHAFGWGSGVLLGVASAILKAGEGEAVEEPAG